MQHTTITQFKFTLILTHSTLQNGGDKQNVCHKLRVKKHGGLFSLDETGDKEEEDVWTTLSTSNVRTLDAWESFESDFSQRETVSSIVRELTGGKNQSLNDIDIAIVIYAAAKVRVGGFRV